jgi:hypothetical protein
MKLFATLALLIALIATGCKDEGPPVIEAADVCLGKPVDGSPPGLIVFPIYAKDHEALEAWGLWVKFEGPIEYFDVSPSPATEDALYFGGKLNLHPYAHVTIGAAHTEAVPAGERTVLAFVTFKKIAEGTITLKVEALVDDLQGLEGCKRTYP